MRLVRFSKEKLSVVARALAPTAVPALPRDLLFPEDQVTMCHETFLIAPAAIVKYCVGRAVVGVLVVYRFTKQERCVSQNRVEKCVPFPLVFLMCDQEVMVWSRRCGSSQDKKSITEGRSHIGDLAVAIIVVILDDAKRIDPQVSDPKFVHYQYGVAVAGRQFATAQFILVVH